MGAETKISREFKDIFSTGGVPAFNEFYNYGIFVWHWIYKGFYNAWHLVSAPTIQNPNRQRKMFHTNIAKAVCAELAGLLWSEKCTVNVSLPHSSDDKAQRFINQVLEANNFTVKMQEAIEQAMALGGEAIKVWCEEKRDGNGKPIAGSGKIKIGYAMADQFVPTSWDNKDITEGVFISRQAKGGYYYTRLEWHKWNGETYVVSNELYRSEQKNQNTQESQDILGFRYPLAEIYPFLDETTPIEGLEHSLFSYFRTPIANNVDDNSPLGISIYANALSTLQSIDICYDSLVREFQLGKKRIIVPARCVRTVVDPNTGKAVRYFDDTDEVYEALATDDTNDLKIQDNSVELRIEEHVDGMNALLQILCLELGFSPSTFSFDVKGGIKTATEVVSENSKTYKTIKNSQTAIEPAIKRLIHNIFAVAILYDIEFEGEKVSQWFSQGSLDGQYECEIYWNDAVIQDRKSSIDEGILLTSNGLMSKERFLIETLGLTEEKAKEELQKIAEEGGINTMTVDKLSMFGAE